MTRRAHVLGGGLQGVCAALALRQAGWDVVVLERSVEALCGASANGEGKIHLGFVYANEPSRATARLMVEGALSFARLVDRWAPGAAWDELRSLPFRYGVLAGSMVGPEALREHYDWVAEEVAAGFASGGDYLGLRPSTVIEEVATGRLPGVAASMVAAFETAEQAVDMARLRPHLLAALATAGVTVEGGALVEAVRRTAGGFAVAGAVDGVARRWDGDLVVNCLWDGRLAVDATMGIRPGRPSVLRLKQSISGRLPRGVAGPTSTTFVLGPFGDIVERADGTLYASWYPACLAGWSDALTVPASWRPLMDQHLSAAERDAHVARILAALAPVVPAVARLEVSRLSAGVIVARGDRDIDDPGSELHSRAVSGVQAHDGYVSIDTGKLTTAPLFAERLLAAL